MQKKESEKAKLYCVYRYNACMQDKMMSTEITMTIDERILAIRNPEEPRQIDAVGVSMANWNDFLVGLLFLRNQRDYHDLLSDALAAFGESFLYQQRNALGPALACKMAVSGADFHVLTEADEHYPCLRRQLLEIRSSSPRPFIALRYHTEEKAWHYRLVSELGYLNSNYSEVPNYA